MDEDSDASKSQKSQRVITFKSKRAPANAKESSKQHKTHEELHKQEEAAANTIS